MNLVDTMRIELIAGRLQGVLAPLEHVCPFYNSKYNRYFITSILRSMRIRNKIETICLFCSKPFLAMESEIKRGNGKFCSRSCFGQYHSSNLKSTYEKINKPNVSCAYCSKEFYKNITKIKASKHKVFFCCREHKDLALRKENNIKLALPTHYKENTFIEYREVYLRARNITCCELCGYNKFVQILEVHHKDRNRKNNTFENLIALCPNCHREEHFTAKDGSWSGN